MGQFESLQDGMPILYPTGGNRNHPSFADSSYARLHGELHGMLAPHVRGLVSRASEVPQPTGLAKWKNRLIGDPRPHSWTDYAGSVRMDSSVYFVDGESRAQDPNIRGLRTIDVRQFVERFALSTDKSELGTMTWNLDQSQVQDITLEVPPTYAYRDFFVAMHPVPTERGLIPDIRDALFKRLVDDILNPLNTFNTGEVITRPFTLKLALQNELGFSFQPHYYTQTHYSAVFQPGRGDIVVNNYSKALDVAVMTRLLDALLQLKPGVMLNTD
jgi:hypothetical protein